MVHLKKGTVMKKNSVSILLIFFFIGCVSNNSHSVNVSKSDIHHIKSESSTSVIEGKKLQYQLWYDKDKWEVIYREHPWYKEMEGILKKNRLINVRTIIHKSQEVFCFVQEERIPGSFQTISNFMHSGHNIIYEEIRKVNGQDVLYTKCYTKDPETSNFVYCYYFLTNKSGTVKVAAGTTKDLFSEHEPHIFDLLNGLVDPSLETQIQPAVEDIESKLLKLKNLKDKGLINQEDYEKSKDRLLNQL
jgi:hypothetical protein